MNDLNTAAVSLSLGRMEGIRENGWCVFRGVPFAKSPVGPMRWMPPQPPEPWDGVLRADRFGAIAPQNPMLEGPGAMEEPEPQNEDCLFLNIWTPDLDDKKRPVMVWIHGGAFSIGSGSSPMYEGGVLARRNDVVVVTINYRLNLLGFLNLNEATNGKIPATGNEGLLDQVAALEWVNTHISAFGGDPGNVTIFGESAGSMSTACLLAMPAAKGLFHKAILESGAGTTSVSLADAAAAGRLFLECAGVGPGDVDALRAISEERLLAIELDMRTRMASPWEPMRITATSPVIDGVVLPKDPTQAVRDGSSKDIPLLVGSNLEEWKLFLMMEPHLDQVDRTAIVERLGHYIPSRYADQIVEQYYQARTKRGDDTGPVEMLSAVNSDLMFRIPSLQLVEAQQVHNQAVYDYLFTYKSPVAGGMLGACHALEMSFVFATHDDKFCGAGPDADQLSRNMQDAWTAFARTGNPGCKAMGQWDVYGRERMTMLIDVRCKMVSAPLEEERKAWDVLGGLANILL